jgi:hypothetical protein
MKKSFLTSLSILAVAMAADASAALPETVVDKLPATKTIEQSSTQSPFVLDKPNEYGIFALHSSHASHASHASHVSSR